MFAVEISNKTAWVTGGNRGIGKAICEALAQAGCNVAVSYRNNADEAGEVVASIKALGKEAIAVQLDVANMSSCEAAHAEIVSKLGNISIVVNNAGITADNLFLMLEEEDWANVINTNLMGVVNVSKIAIKDLMMQRWGRIINISSVAATKGGRGQANYSASKGAIEAMSRSLAVELSKRNITVNCIAPGVIETEMSEEVRKLAHDEIMQRQLIKRYGTPEEIAAWVVFLASDFGEYMTGQVVHIDGGLKMP